MVKREKFSGSEEFTKSLEPNFKSYSEQEKEIFEKMKKTYSKTNNANTQREEEKLEEMSNELKEGTKNEKNFKNFKGGISKNEEYSKGHHQRRKRFEVFAAIYLLLMLIFTFFLAMSTNSNLFLVVLSFIPTILMIVVAMIMYESHTDNKNILWVLPVIFIYAFHWFGSTQGGIVKGIDINTITGVNIFLSFFYLIINYFLLQRDFPKEESKTETKLIVKEADIPVDLATFIASIEDKSKALNFVIGRVYNTYHGGSKHLREKINMKQEWYDQFSSVPTDPKRIDFPALERLIKTIQNRLKQLEKSEVEVFGPAQENFKNLVRDKKGLDRVIDVLDKNDKDPVKSYYDGALQFCGKVKELIDHDITPSVENEYIERPEEQKKNKKEISWSNIKNIFKN